MTGVFGIRQREWYVATMDDGVISPRHETKRAAVHWLVYEHTIERHPVRRLAPGLYQVISGDAEYYVGRGDVLFDEGFEGVPAPLPARVQGDEHAAALRRNQGEET